MRVEEYGAASERKALGEQERADEAKQTQLSMGGTLIILLLAFGAMVAAGVPLLLGVTSVVATTGLLGPVSQLAPLHDAVAQVVMLVGLAVGVDYAMFYLRRMMEERDKGRSSDVALDIAAATSGRAVLISGFTVMAAMGGMFFSGNPIFVSFGIGTILVVGVAVIGSLTFLPAVLSYLGQKNWLEKGRVPWVAKRRHSTNGESRVWSAILDRVLARPLVSAILAGGILVALSVPALGMQFKEPGTEGMSRSQPIIQTLDRIDAAFPGGSVPATVIVKAADVTTPEVQGAIKDLHDKAIATGRLHEPSGIEISPDKTVAIVALSIDGKGTDAASNRSIETLREQVVPATVGQLDGAEVAVSGGTAWSKDFLDTMKSHLPIVFGFVLSLAFILLLVTFRSIVVPIKAIILNLLSVGAAYGILTLVFQDGHGEKLLGFTSVGGIAPWLPLFLFVILFGLSMDYHVFVLSRIREAVDRGMSTDKAVAHGIKSHGRRDHQRRGRHGRHLRDVRHGRRPVDEAARRRPGGGDPDRRHAGPRGAPARDDEAPGQAQLVPAQGPGLAAEVRARARGGARRRLIRLPFPELRRPPSWRAPALLGLVAARRLRARPSARRGARATRPSSARPPPRRRAAGGRPSRRCALSPFATKVTWTRLSSSAQSKRADLGRVAVRRRRCGVGEGVEEPLDGHRHRAGHGDGEAVRALAGGAQAVRALVGVGDRLRVPGQRVDAELLGDPAGDLAVRAPGRAPGVEPVEPLLPAVPGALADRRVGRREHGLRAEARLLAPPGPRAARRGPRCSSRRSSPSACGRGA